MSSLDIRSEQAVCVRRAHKKYGSRRNPIVALNGLNMTVPKGSIFGLLGASGCGKTTLLHCIVGRKRLDSGEIWVLGGKPGSKGSGVPGPRVGYMPQENALYGEFTIRETMQYFGWVSKISSKQVEENFIFLTDLLMLPDANCFVKKLSGGQQRRVSLAATLIHEPELLILDEPTVGADPVVRENVWNHLKKITSDGKATVIITTHYFDETKQANKIGLMRGGYFLAEDSPTNLLTQFTATRLEDVFLKLSILQNLETASRQSSDTDNVGCMLCSKFGDNVSISNTNTNESSDVIENAIPIEEAPVSSHNKYLPNIQMHHMKALLWKNFMWMWRNLPIMMFLIGLPVFNITMFCLSIGTKISYLRLGVVNHELQSNEACKEVPLKCQSLNLSCYYLNLLVKEDYILLYENTDEAGKDLVRRGDAWATLIIPNNFSTSIHLRLTQLRRAKPPLLLSSTISVYQDQTNINIAANIWKDLIFLFNDFNQEYLLTCKIKPRFNNFMHYEEPVFGSWNHLFLYFAAPGVVLSSVFFLALSVSYTAMLFERNQGIVERSLVNGISSLEILLSLIITQIVVVLGQAAVTVFFMYGVFGIEQIGSYSLVILLTVLTGFCGMCYGFVVACTCNKVSTAAHMAMGSFLPSVALAGIIWPIEGMPRALYYVAYVLPLTLATAALRSIMSRGWTVWEPAVYKGFAAVLLWSVFFLAVTITLLKFKRS